MSALPRPRIVLCGIPLTLELLLRLSLLAITLAVLTLASRPKIQSILKEDKVVAVSMIDSSHIPVPSTLICGQLMETVDVEIVTRGIRYDNGTVGPDHKRPVPPAMVHLVNASTLPLRAQGDWPREGKCVILEPNGLYFAKNVDGRDTEALDTIAFVVQSKDNFTVSNDIGLSFSIWDGNVAMVDQQPIWVGIPSINTMTFVYSEHILLDQEAAPQTRYTVQKQNLRMMQPRFFANQKVIGRFVLSPDTFYVTKYIDKPSYTWVDMAGALGGMASLALAVWIFLFGGGKYKSWGVVQRYILQTSPNARRNRNRQSMGQKGDSIQDTAHRSVYDSIKQFLQRQVARLDSSAEHDPHPAPFRASLDEQRRLSIRYIQSVQESSAPPMDPYSAPYSRQYSHQHHSSSKRRPEPSSSRLSMESTASANYYFSDRGAPGSRSLQPLPSRYEGLDDPEEQVDELIRLIDLRIDERMWSLEKTLARYYLEGFRLRNYAVTPESRATLPDGDRDARSERVVLDSIHSRSSLLALDNLSSVVSPSLADPQPEPQYPQPHWDQDVDGPLAPKTSPEVDHPGFPARRDMRGSIRKAVQRLQNEWPQSGQSSRDPLDDKF